MKTGFAQAAVLSGDFSNPTPVTAQGETFKTVVTR
jgi:hypothetical protein